MKAAICSVLLLTFATGMSGQANSERVPVGFIESIDGHPTLMPSSEILNKDTDRGRILFRGESLKCVAGAKVRGALLGPDKASASADLCILLASANGDGQVSAAPNAVLRDSLERFGRRAGRDKGGDSPIFEPAPNAAILPGTLIVHWRTRPPLDTFTATLQDASGKTIAQVPGVDGAAGLLDSAVIRDALLGMRVGAIRPIPAKLIFRDASDSQYSTNFFVLPERDEQEMKVRLDQVSFPGGLLAHIERASVFESYSLYDNVAVEYGHALEEAPRSLDLLRAAGDAYARIGDLGHAREVIQRLDAEESGNRE